jgi:hypothetical protein
VVMPVQALWLIVVFAIVALAASGPVVERVEGVLRYEASLPKQTYKAGEPVPVSVGVTNTGSGPVSLTFNSGQRYDLVIRRPRGDEVWRWSYDKAFIQVIQTVKLQPQGSLAYTAAWDQKDFQARRVDAGSYEALAIFYGRVEGGREMRLAPLPFTITP